MKWIKLFEEWEADDDWDEPDQGDRAASGIEMNSFEKIQRFANRVESQLGVKLIDPDTYEFDDPESYGIEPESASVWYVVKDSPALDQLEADEIPLTIGITQMGKFAFTCDSSVIQTTLNNNLVYGDNEFGSIDQLTPAIYDEVIDWLKENEYLESND